MLYVRTFNQDRWQCDTLLLNCHTLSHVLLIKKWDSLWQLEYTMYTYFCIERRIVERSPVKSFYFILRSPYRKIENLENLELLGIIQKKMSKFSFYAPLVNLWWTFSKKVHPFISIYYICCIYTYSNRLVNLFIKLVHCIYPLFFKSIWLMNLWWTFCKSSCEP